jgi:ABC-type sugar transport system substrate-binding protein
MRLLERRALLARAERAGIPVVAWRGPGTLDEVMRRLRRRAVAPGGRR